MNKEIFSVLTTSLFILSPPDSGFSEYNALFIGTASGTFAWGLWLMFPIPEQDEVSPPKQNTRAQLQFGQGKFILNIPARA